jgi:hypothetical protein
MTTLALSFDAIASGGSLVSEALARSYERRSRRQPT